MNLLPKSHKEFGQKDYWNTFFQKRGQQAFDWYGEYLELCGQLHKYIKQTDVILVTGCGNSTLSSDMYDVGYHNITNIDLSEIVIKQMRLKNKDRKQMKYVVMDALSTDFESETFNVILDKGTLDALMPDNSEDVSRNIDKYFNEVKRLLKYNGRYVCVSLLQEHILQKLLHSFDCNWAFRIVRCHEAEIKYAEENGDGNAMPVFIVIATKFNKLPKKILELCLAGEKICRSDTVENVISSIKYVQDAAMITNGVVKHSLVNENEVVFDLSRPGESTPRYTVHIMDQLHHHSSNKYAVFIVPQGRELEWMFSTSEGRKELLSSVRFGRLLIVTMHRGQEYGDLDLVKDELTDTAKSFAPYNYKGQIPFLSIGSDVGKREKVFEGKSKISGAFVVEDVDIDGETFRRLIFLDNQSLIQSEAKIKHVSTKSEKKATVDPGYLACSHHSYMSVGVELSQSDHPNGKVAVIGLGGGGLSLFLHKCYDHAPITAVDIDEAILRVATQYFDLIVENNLKVLIQDGLDFIKNEAEKGESYAAILFDVDSKDRSVSLSCPPKPFMEEDVLMNVVKLLSNNAGEKICRSDTVENVISSIKYVQDAAMITNGVVKHSLVNENEVVFDLSRPGESTPRYTVHIMDQLHHHSSNKYAVFIVPQGRELEWMFSTSEGRKELLSSVRFGRLLIVTMHRGQEYGDLDLVKDELTDTAKSFAPYNYKGQIPFLSIGSDVGKREKVFEGKSKISGAFVVEDVDIDGETFRRLIFLDNQSLIQSEAKIKHVSTKSEKKATVDPGYLACSHHSYMSVGVELSQSDHPNGKVAVIGLGGGGLSLFLHKCYDHAPITAVDIDEAILRVATQYFDLIVENNLKVLIQDGLDFIKNEAEKGESYAAILFDVDSKDRSVSLSCPPKPFMEEDVLMNVVKLLSNNGIFILNLVCREIKLHDELVNKLKKHFKRLILFNVEQEVNEVVFCSNSKEDCFVREKIEEAIKRINATAKNKKITRKCCVKLEAMMKSINIVT